MSKANLTTRRGFSRWLAGVGAIITAPAVAVAAPVGVTADWDALEQEYLDCIADVWSKKGRADDARKAWHKWQRRYPRPVEPYYNSHDERIADSERFAAESRAYNKRWFTVYNGMNLGKLEGAHNEAARQWLATEKRIAAIPARNAADLKAKARIARRNPGGWVQAALADDLQGIENLTIAQQGLS